MQSYMPTYSGLKRVNLVESSEFPAEAILISASAIPHRVSDGRTSTSTVLHRGSDGRTSTSTVPHRGSDGRQTSTSTVPHRGATDDKLHRQQYPTAEVTDDKTSTSTVLHHGSDRRQTSTSIVPYRVCDGRTATSTIVDVKRLWHLLLMINRI